jgi:hypothetical protein
MDGSDGYPLIRDPAMQTFSSTTYYFVVLMFAALKKKGKKACVLLPASCSDEASLDLILEKQEAD